MLYGRSFQFSSRVFETTRRWNSHLYKVISVVSLHLYKEYLTAVKFKTQFIVGWGGDTPSPILPPRRLDSRLFIDRWRDSSTDGTTLTRRKTATFSAIEWLPFRRIDDHEMNGRKTTNATLVMLLTHRSNNRSLICTIDLLSRMHGSTALRNSSSFPGKRIYHRIIGQFSP